MAEDQSFSSQVKDELAHELPALPCCQRMELAALLRASGRVSLAGAGRLSVSLSTDYAPVARKVIKLVKAVFPGMQTEVLVMRRRRLRKNLIYQVRIPPQDGVTKLLIEMGILSRDGNLTDWGNLPLLHQDHCRRSYLRGTFLGSGWVSSPERQHHLEMTTTETEAAEALGQMLFAYNIPVRVNYRKDYMVLYLKDDDQIIRFLGLVGAHQSLFRYEDIRAKKELRNRVNRQVNAETANLNKTVDAAQRQLEALRRLASLGGLDSLSPALRELATLRINNPDASLKELGEMCNPPVGKSGINHRMRMLMGLIDGAN
ncbi:MAG TPA: DNA-binding protein WhiA [Symbiobacteriaceae bacterium]|nr:DNA-binding protein WhiA [Symbiobacteriaceae bacterium]